MILKLTVLMILACVADLALRRAPAALRHLMWSLTLVAALLLPVAGWYAPGIAGKAFVIHSSSAAVGALMATAPSKFNWLLAIYAAGAAILLARLALDIFAANRLVREAKAASLPGVRVSSRATVPFAWGSIVVPAAFESWSEERRAAVVEHEAAHIGRGDMWTSLLARLACAVYWFHPLAWWAASRMRLDADRACDDAVLRRGFSDAGYAEDLVTIARSLQPSALAPAAVHVSDLEVRVRHILASGVNRRKLGAAAACVAVLTCIGVAYPLAALSQQNKSKTDTETVFKMTDGVKAPRVLARVDPEYTPEARAAKISGAVLLQVTIGSDGVARDCLVVRSLDPGLDANAITAIEQWKFQPGTKDGDAVSVRASIEINFRLK